MSDVIRIETLPELSPRALDSHKGDFGRVLVVGGSVGMIGAPALTANAALRSGAGLVTVACPLVVQQSVAVLCPCATTFPVPQSPTGTFASSAVPVLRTLSERMNVLAVGPGLGRHLELGDIVKWSLDQGDKPVILDADGLNTLSELTDWWPVLAPLVLTPHPGEMRGLLKSVGLSPEFDSSPEARLKVAIDVARRADCVVVLKGQHTVVSDGRRAFVNQTGNPGMATGGSGDVLSGVIAALVGQGLPVFEAAVLGTHAHGLAGDLAAQTLGQVGLVATDLIDHLPRAWIQLAAKA